MKIFGKSKRRVLVLGAGPAGLFAAWAAREKGYEVEILSQRTEPSHMFGAQYLHRPIPGLSDESVNGHEMVDYRMDGTALGYAEKVYGPERGPLMSSVVSPATLTGQHAAWDIRHAYECAWREFKDVIDKSTVSEKVMDHLLSYGSAHYIISSIPPQAYCLYPQMHQFSTAEIWSKGDAPELDLWCPVRVDPFTVVCNGEKSPGWYRASNVFGYRTAEWPGYRKPPVDGVALVKKPIATNCNCFGGGRVLRVGRYGTWTKGQLSHDAYYDTKDFLK